jgi:hypothetical protein
MIRKTSTMKNFVLISAIVVMACSLAEATVSVKIFSLDEAMSNSNLSKPRIYVQNTGTETINDFTYRYFITPEGSYTPLIDPYYLPNSTVALVPYGGGFYVQYTVTGAFCPTVPVMSSGSTTVPGTPGIKRTTFPTISAKPLPKTRISHCITMVPEYTETNPAPHPVQS